MEAMRIVIITLFTICSYSFNSFAQKGKWMVGLEVNKGINTFDWGGESQIRRDLTVYPVRGLAKSAVIEKGQRQSLGLTAGHQVLNWLRIETGVLFNTTSYSFHGEFDVNIPRFSPGGDMELPLSPILIQGKSTYHNLEFDLNARVYPWRGRLRCFLSPSITASYYLSNTREQDVLYENGLLEAQMVGEDVSSYPAVWLIYAGGGAGVEFHFNSKIEIALISEIGINLNAYRRDRPYTQRVATLGGAIKLGYKL